MLLRKYFLMRSTWCTGSSGQTASWDSFGRFIAQTTSIRLLPTYPAFPSYLHHSFKFWKRFIINKCFLLTTSHILTTLTSQQCARHIMWENKTGQQVMLTPIFREERAEQTTTAKAGRHTLEVYELVPRTFPGYMRLQLEPLVQNTRQEWVLDCLATCSGKHPHLCPSTRNQ